MMKERKKSMTKDGGGVVDNKVRYLVLCRVVIGSVFVTSKEYRGFPSVGKDPSFHSMYNPLMEEYLVLQPGQVLPEFLIQYTYKTDSAASKEHAPLLSSKSGELTPAIPVDLSSPQSRLPVLDWESQILTLEKPEKKNFNPGMYATAVDKRISKMPLACSSSDKDDTSTTSRLPDPQKIAATASYLSNEIMRREQLTSWEQLRLNAARQREVLLDSSDSLLADYKRKMAQLKEWERRRCSKFVNDQSQLDTAESMRAAVANAEAELVRQVSRRREMEAEMMSLRRRQSSGRLGRRSSSSSLNR